MLDLSHFLVSLRRNRMFFILLFSGWTAAVTALPGHDSKTGFHLSCANDGNYTMFCDLDDSQNCTGLNLTLTTRFRTRSRTNSCTPILCSSGHCCCSIQMCIIFGETHNATVWREGQRMGSKIIDISSTIKPNRPSIRPVEEVNGKLLIKWKTNVIKTLDNDITATVTYRRKGDTKEVSINVKPATSNGLKTHIIHSRDLEPNTVYVVRVTSLLYNVSSESSDEIEFTTPASPSNGLPVVIVSLSVVAVLIAILIFGFFVKIKKLWDTGARWQDSKLLNMKSTEEMLLEPERIIIAGVNIVPIYTNDNKSCYTSKESVMDSSVEDYSVSSSVVNTKIEPPDVVARVQEALAKVLPNFNLSPFDNRLTNNDSKVQDDDADSKSLNKTTYSVVIPSSPSQSLTQDCQTTAGMLFDSGYHPSKDNGMMAAADLKLLFHFSHAGPSSLPVDMSYQQCSTDSGVSTLSYSSGNNADVEADSINESLSWDSKLHGNSLESTLSEQNPFFGCLHPGPKGFLPVIDDYQTI